MSAPTPVARRSSSASRSAPSSAPTASRACEYHADRGHHEQDARRRRCAASARRRPTIAIETAIDKVAAALGLDRIEVRRRNLIRKDEFPYLIPSGTHYDSGDYHTVVAKVLAACRL